MTRPARCVALLGSPALLLAAGLLLPPDGSVAVGPPVSTTGPATSPQPGPMSPSVAPRADVPPAAAGRADRPAPGAPVRLGLPTLAVDAPVQEVQTSGGVLGVPDDPRVVGWWTGSSLAGAAQGTTVVDGHVDSAARGLGALFALRRLVPGDPVTVSTGTATLTYRVTGQQVYDKTAGLPEELFRETGPPGLVLITCGGAFDARTRHYADNVVVLAEPV